jgi:hypothetical protein
MARQNPSNPYSQDPEHTAKDVSMPLQKARVLDAKGMPDGNGFHTVRIKVYGDESPYMAPVLTPMVGSVWVPQAGEDVAVMFGAGDKPWVIGSWYPVDRVDDGTIDLPDYEPGQIRIGNDEGYIGVAADGTIISSGSLGGSTYSDEDSQDAVAAALTGGTNVSVTYDDPNDTITLDGFSGDHSDLTNVTADQPHTKTTSQNDLTDFSSDSENIYVQDTEPSNPSENDIWIDTGS